MADRNKLFRIAVRKFGPFESAIAKQWAAFDARHHTGLSLQAVPSDLPPLYQSLFVNRGLIHGEWDVAFINTDWLAEAGESAGLADLSPFINASPPDGYPGAWSESLLRLQKFGARILGLPYHDGPECLLYRKDLFESPMERSRFAAVFGEPLELPRTWEQFHRIARFFTRPEQALYGTAFAAFPDGHNTVYDFCLQLWTRNGELFDSSGRMLLDTPQALESLEYYRQILKDVAAVHPASRTFDSVKAGFAFAAGEIAMMVNWFGFASMSETIAESQVKGRVGIAPIPSGSDESVSLNVYWILGIASGSPHRDIAWKFLRHCASPEMDKLLTLEGGIGCRQSTWSDAEVNAAIPFYHVLETLHEGARELPRLRQWAKLAEVIDGMVLDVIDTQEPIATIIQRAQARADYLRAQLEGAQPA
jgi:multiple sugar transport system substrate-binding protein